MTPSPTPSEGEAMPYADQAIFDAIAAATHIHGEGHLEISVPRFLDVFNNHRDRELCTSMRAAAQSSGVRAVTDAMILAGAIAIEGTMRSRAESMHDYRMRVSRACLFAALSPDTPREGKK